MTSKKLTTGYYWEPYYKTYIWAKTDWPYVRILNKNGKWSRLELIMIDETIPTPDLMFLLSGIPIAT